MSQPIDQEELIRHLAVEGTPSPSLIAEATLAQIRAEIETLEGEVRRPPPDDPYFREPELEQALTRLLREAPITVTKAELPPHGMTSNVEPTEGLGTIREYRLLSKLGEGGMGAVYKAQHTKLKRVVALKMLPVGVVNTPGIVARFEREMQAVGALDHPNIVRAHDAGEADGRHYLVMEYVKGRDLTQLSRDCGTLPIAEACELIRQAAMGLQHAHEAGLVHRDIKPSNLMLTDTGVVKVLDLGLALLSSADGAGELTSTGQVMGTIDYMAPEQGGDTHHVDIRADIYSLGATLYKLLTGVAPFGDPKFDTPVKKLMALATQEPIPIKQRRAEIPPPLAALVAKMMAKNPATRYATPAELAKALAPFTAGGNLPQLAARVAGGKASPAIGEAETQPSLKSASVDTLTPTIVAVPKGEGLWCPFNRLPPVVRCLALGGAAAMVLAGIVLFLQTPNGTIKIEFNDPAISVRFDQDGATIDGADPKPIKLKLGKQGIVIKRGDFEFLTTSFKLEKKGETTLEIQVLAGEVKVSYDGKEIERKVVPQLVAANQNFALEFDGRSTYVEIPTLSYDGKTALTIEFWVCQMELARGFTVNQQGANAVGIMLNENPQWQFARANEDHLDLHVSTTPPPAGKLVHIAGTWDGEQLRIFTDGIPSTPNTSRYSEYVMKPNSSFMMGVLPNGIDKNLWQDYFKGTIDEVRISKVARYDKEFTPKQHFKPDADTLALYHCDEGTGDKLVDSSGNNHHGNIVGARWVRTGELEPSAEPGVTPIASSANQAPANAVPALVGRKADNYTVKPYWAVTDGELLFGSDEFKHQWIFFGDKNWTDYDFQVRILRLRSGSGSGGVSLAFRSLGPNFENTGLFSFGSKGVSLVFNISGKDFFAKQVNGVEVPALAGANEKIVKGRWYTLKVEVRGSSVRCFLDGKPQGTFDKVPFPRGRVGLHIGPATYRFRDIQVTAPEGTVLWNGLPNLPASPVPVPQEFAAVLPTPAIAPFDAVQAKVHQEVWAKHLGVPVEYTNSVDMTFRLIPPGEFTMGSTEAEMKAALSDIRGTNPHWRECIQSEVPEHKVILTKPIYFGIHEVTQGQYAELMGNNPSHFSASGPGKFLVAGMDTARHPVELASWNDAAQFCTKLSEKEQQTPYYGRSGNTVTFLNGNGYRLPTEAQWQFGCRAGTTTKYWCGSQSEDLSQAAWFGGERTAPVGQLKANPFGLYDTHGNVWEWCEDWWDPSYYRAFANQSAIDPSGPSSGVLRVLCGGNWPDHASACRSSSRYAFTPPTTHFGTGFRVALSVEAVRRAKR